MRHSSFAHVVVDDVIPPHRAWHAPTREADNLQGSNVLILAKQVEGVLRQLERVGQVLQLFLEDCPWHRKHGAFASPARLLRPIGFHDVVGHLAAVDHAGRGPLAVRPPLYRSGSSFISGYAGYSNGGTQRTEGVRRNRAPACPSADIAREH